MSQTIDLLALRTRTVNGTMVNLLIDLQEEVEEDVEATAKNRELRGLHIISTKTLTIGNITLETLTSSERSSRRILLRMNLRYISSREVKASLMRLSK